MKVTSQIMTNNVSSNKNGFGNGKFFKANSKLPERVTFEFCEPLFK